MFQTTQYGHLPLDVLLGAHSLLDEFCRVFLAAYLVDALFDDRVPSPIKEDIHVYRSYLKNVETQYTAMSDLHEVHILNVVVEHTQVFLQLASQFYCQEM